MIDVIDAVNAVTLITVVRDDLKDADRLCGVLENKREDCGLTTVEECYYKYLKRCIDAAVVFADEVADKIELVTTDRNQGYKRHARDTDRKYKGGKKKCLKS